MATGGFKPNATTDFLEEWKAKREKMRAKMLGDIAAATGANNSRHASPAGDSPERGASAGNCHPSPCAVVRSSSGGALRRAEEEAAHHPVSPESSPRKATPQADKAPCASPDSSPMACNDADKESPSPGKGKEKKSSGPSARKGKGQIEKRKLREKRRSTGVVSIPSNEVSPSVRPSARGSIHGMRADKCSLTFFRSLYPITKVDLIRFQFDTKSRSKT